jgi:hypothetical protein
VCPRARLRDELAISNERLDAMAPEALDLAAECVALLHDALLGRASQLSGHREPDYRRGQLIGRHPVTLADLCWLALEAPEAVRALLIPLAAACDLTLTPLVAHPQRGLVSEAAEMGEAAISLTRGTADAMEDGVLSQDERTSLRAQLDKVRRELADVEARLSEGEPWRDCVTRRVKVHRDEVEAKRRG